MTNRVGTIEILHCALLRSEWQARKGNSVALKMTRIISFITNLNASNDLSSWVHPTCHPERQRRIWDINECRRFFTALRFAQNDNFLIFIVPYQNPAVEIIDIKSLSQYWFDITCHAERMEASELRTLITIPDSSASPQNDRQDSVFCMGSKGYIPWFCGRGFFRRFRGFWRLFRGCLLF